MNSIAGVINVQYGALIDVILELRDGPDTWSGDGVWTIEQFLARRIGVSPSTASALTAIAGRGRRPTDLRTSLSRRPPLARPGRIDCPQAPWWTDAESRDYATLMTVSQLRRVMSKYPFPALDEHGREIRAEPDAHADGDADDEARDQLFLHGHTATTTADALREVCERSLDSIDSPSRRNRFKLSMFFETNGTMNDTRGRHVPDSIRQHISCDSTITPILLDNGLPVSIGRAQHIVPDRVRTLIERRDHGICRVPGCTSTLGLEVHHITHGEHDGPTDTWNLILICGHHHRMHHHGTLGITGNADDIDGITCTNSHGRIIRQSGAAPNPPDEPPAPPPLPYQHPVGEQLHADMILFTPPAAHREQLLQRTRANGGTATDYLNSFKT